MVKLKQYWWKITGILLLIYALPMAWLGEVSVQVILHETIRNLYFHVTMWFAMIFLFGFSFFHAIQFLRKGNLISDMKSTLYAEVGMVFGAVGIVTGMIWANFTWGAPWVNDPKLNGAAVALLIYIAYFILKSSITESIKRAKTASVYNIFSFVMLILLIGIMPRINDSLHPGNGGNPGFGGYALKNSMRPVFYSAVVGWTIVGLWLAEVKIKWKSKLIE